MSLKHALLGFIDMFPVSGYDLNKMFHSTVTYYWPATHTQIYQTLAQMAKDGLVEIELVEQQDHPNKKLYHITDKGKQVLRDWITTPMDLPVLRHPLLIQLSWADRLETPEIVRLLESYSRKLRERLALYQDQNQDLIIEYARSGRERLLWQLTLDNGIAMYESELRWAEEAIRRLEALE
jgi:PadR family transcriptional regulator AphA